MAILGIYVDDVGHEGQEPRIVRIETNDSVSTITTAGYLDDAVKKNLVSLRESDICAVVTKESSTAAKEAGWYEVSYSSGSWSLVPPASPGDVVLPTVANRLAHFSNTTGTLSGAAADVTNLGDMTLGASGTEGILNLYPGTAAKGSLILKAIDNTGDTSVTISNAAHGQASVISIPDGGQATSEFIIADSAGTQHITSGAFQVDAGSISSGLAAGGSAGSLVLWANTTASGNLAMLAVDNGTGDFDTVISNANAVGQDQTITVPDAGASTANFILSANAASTQSISTGISITGAANNVQTTGGGNLIAGSSGAAGSVFSYPATALKGSLELRGADNTNDDDVTITNAEHGQASVYTIPDSGAATANFLLDEGSANILAHQQFVGLESILSISDGTWTITRIAQGDYAYRHSAADDTSIIGIDITPMIRATASKGFRLDSFDVIYSVTTLALDAHTVTLDRIEYADNSAVSVNSIPITGTLAVATQANPYLTNIAVDTPAFDVTADSKYIIELTVDADATSEYDFYGIMLRFSQTIA
jgi:hypothetical protein